MYKPMLGPSKEQNEHTAHYRGSFFPKVSIWSRRNENLPRAPGGGVLILFIGKNMGAKVAFIPHWHTKMQKKYCHEVSGHEVLEGPIFEGTWAKKIKAERRYKTTPPRWH